MILKSLRAALRMRRGKPTFVSFNVSARCNEACPMCSVWRSAGEELPLPEIETIFADLKRFGFLVAEVSGGEPFLRPDLFDIFATLDRLGFLYSCTTNGTVLTPSHVVRLAEARGLLQLAVSLDTLDRERYRELRGRDLLPRVLETIDLLAAAPPPQPVKLNMTLSRLNFRETFRILDFARERGLSLSVFPVTLGGGFEHRAHEERLLPSPKEREEMAELFRELAALRRAGAPLWEYSGFYLKASDYLLGKPMGRCGAGALFADLHADGTLAPCVDLPPRADLRRERVATAWPRIAGEHAAIRRCSETSPCCYTCSYNIALTAAHPVAFLAEAARVTMRRPGRRRK